jgi:membrane-bound serine protease (ClpP class)
VARAERGLIRLIRLAGLLLVLVGLLVGMGSSPARATSHVVYVAQIENEIDLGLAAYLKRVLDEADDKNAAAVILEINTPGGRLDAALEMRDAILDADVLTVAFINREAFSAGALIALAADEIYMTPGAVFGAATPVTGAGETADEKIVSAVRSTFRSTAELHGRNPLIAEAMVDPDVEVEGLVESGDLLTLTTTDAVEWDYADGVASSLDDLLATLELASTEVQIAEVRLAERLVRFLTNPVVASLLISLGTLMILIDLFTAGVGLVGAVGVGLLATFFWGHFLAGLAGWEGVILVAIGLLLLAAEALVVPGFGVAGILGIAALLGGMYLSLVGDDIVTDQAIRRAGLTVGASFLTIIVGGVALLALLPHASRFQGLVLQSQVGLPTPEPMVKRRRRWFRAETPEEFLSPHAPHSPQPLEPSGLMSGDRAVLDGARGVALNDLRPSGFIQIGDEQVDVVTRGDFIPAGELVEVIRDEGYRRIVRRVKATE